MTHDEIIRMAREAGFETKVLNSIDGEEVLCFDPLITDMLKDFAALVAAHERNRHAWTQEHWTEYEHAIAAAEREACAKVVETDGLNLCEGDKDMQRMYIRNKVWRDHYAAAIRARSNHG